MEVSLTSLLKSLISQKTSLISAQSSRTSPERSIEPSKSLAVPRKRSDDRSVEVGDAVREVADASDPRLGLISKTVDC